MFMKRYMLSFGVSLACKLGKVNEIDDYAK